MRIAELADALNSASIHFEVGRLQEERARLRSLRRAPCRGIFSKRSIHGGYAFHAGGRTELQFNIGGEKTPLGDMIRHGVAFSLQLSQTLPSLDPLLPKLKRFNDYVQSRPEDFPGFHMWHFHKGDLSEDRAVGPIPDDLIAVDTFIMLGRRVPVDEVNVRRILADFDRLLPLYVYVETNTDRHSSPVPSELDFKPGCPSFVESTSRTLPEPTVEVALRHQQLQKELYKHRCQEAGRENVRVEQLLAFGVRVDAVVHQDGEYSFYELKVAPTAQSCIRAALGQLLEYAYWPATERASELIIVGEPELREDDSDYLRLLRQRFDLPLWYRRIDTDRSVLEKKS